MKRADEGEADEERYVVPISSLGCKGRAGKAGSLIKRTRIVVRLVSRKRSIMGGKSIHFLKSEPTENVAPQPSGLERRR